MALLTYPAADRNKEPIAEVLARVLPAEGVVLEIASGTGQHVVHFAKRLPKLVFQPSDPGADERAAIDARRVESGLANVRAALALDVLAADWAHDLGTFDAMFCANMIHIAPWEATTGLMAGATALLAPGAPCLLYGPFRFGGRFLAESNATFDASLRARDPRWGVRDLDDVTRVAEAAGLAQREVVEMPANNHVVVFVRR